MSVTTSTSGARTVAALPGGARKALLAGSGIIALLAVWWLAVEVFGLDANHTLASPPEVARRLADLLVAPLAGHTLLGHAGVSLARWGVGFGVAAVSGVVTGYVFAWYPLIRAVLLPLFEVLRYIAPFAWIPLAILWLRPGLAAQAFVVFIAVFPACVLNAEAAVRRVDPALVRAAAVFGGGTHRTLTSVAIPTGAPLTIAGLQIGVGNGWMALMGAELIVGHSGLGFVILSGQQSSDPALIIAGMVAIGVLGAAMDLLLRVVTRPFTRWTKGLGTKR
ncbi:ABC transporter permease [Nocardia paucivorans]|uniref:ABC transporter permease n=1 Tax=Nocardia paucivorans TaxID=114259 RepID=UPI0002F2B0D7|nr:ABC transporter permease [Nocardia paucivorans]